MKINCCVATISTLHLIAELKVTKIILTAAVDYITLVTSGEEEDASQNSRVDTSVNGRRLRIKIPQKGRISGFSQVCCLGNVTVPERKRPRNLLLCCAVARIIAAIVLTA